MLGFVIGNYFHQNFAGKAVFALQKVVVNSEHKTISADELYDETLSENLFHEVKIICWVITHPANHRNKSLHVKGLWGKRCNKLLFMSSKEDPELGTVALPVGDGRGKLWQKTVETYKHVSR
jgi:hypothetical protein